MAQRRMFSLKIVSSDAFLDMSVSARELYFQLGMYADDDGFINPKKIVRLVGASDDDLKILLAKRFLLPFESGVVVIKHWAINNQLRKDYYQPTLYQEEKKRLYIKDNKAYTDRKQSVNKMLTTRKHSIDKISIDKIRLKDTDIVNKVDTPFSLKEEIQKLYDNQRRDLNIIGLYLEYRKPVLENKKQYEITLKRHLKAAKDLSSFSDDQIIKAMDYAKKEYKDIYTLETIIKILTK